MYDHPTFLFNKKNSLKKRMHFFTINICISHINNISEKKNSNSNFILPSLFFVCSISSLVFIKSLFLYLISFVCSVKSTNHNRRINMTDIYEDRVTSEEYKQWKKNTPFMYDFMMTRILEYPSQTVQWFNDDIEKIDDDPHESMLQRLLFGTNTGSFNDDNHLIIASITLPGYQEPPKIDLYNMPEDAFGTFVHYNDQLEADFKIYHNGSVECARSMPQKENIIATRNHNDLFIYDIKDCLADYNVAGETSPIHIYPKLNSEINLEWNSQTSGLLLTGYDRHRIAIWDMNSQKKRKSLTTKLVLGGCDQNDNDNVGFIYDASWHQKHPEICASTTSKGNILLWDIRSNNVQRPSHYFTGHKGSAFQIKFNPFSEYVFITSGSDCQIAAWDLRNLNEKLHSIQLKQEKFHTLKWSSHCETLFAALTNDRKVYLFDMDKIFDELLPQEIDNGPSSLTFIHGGHTSRICDFDWNHNDINPLMICSVSDDNVFQIWQMSSKYVTQDTNRTEI
ncbi:histone-binding protein RBBP4-A-like [Dermatophagoides pteronyssinus]|uniref:histone-binding protein RBBP4-A-like n=1 Tax=Dermatophagoides pteronyssinus TaxID=6956 RepID=UPI003F670472